MEPEYEKYVDEYKNLRPKYESFTKTLEDTIEKLLNIDKISFSHIESRTKTIESFKNKISRDGKNYDNPIKEITDLSGIRIIIFSNNDILPVEKIIKDEFDIDEKNSCDKSKQLQLNQFGYLSNHLIVSMKDERAKLRENKDFNGLKAEIQIRTVLQHAWAAIEHKVNYKSSITLPEEQKRDFYRLAAVLELADKEFQNCINAQSKKIEAYKQSIEKDKTLNIELNSESLLHYFESDNVIEKLSKIKNERLCLDLELNEYPSSQLIELLKKANFSSIKQIDDLITNKKYLTKLDSVIKNWTENISDSNLKLVLNKLTLLRLLTYFSLDQKSREEFLEKRLLKNSLRNIVSKIA